MFKKHFNKTPIVSQPVQIKASSISVEMLLQVYESGDVFVRYGEFQQWLPFRNPKVAHFSLFPEAMAQTAPTPSVAVPEVAGSAPGDVKWQRVEQLNFPLIIDIDKIIQAPPSLKRPASTDTWTKAFLISEIQQDRAPFSATTKTYQKVFSADPGFLFTKVNLDLGSANKAHVQNVQIIDGGKTVQVQYSLTSGPLFDQYRGWIHATIKTEQEKVR